MQDAPKNKGGRPSKGGLKARRRRHHHRMISEKNEISEQVDRWGVTARKEPKPRNPGRRRPTKGNLRKFLETYLPESFPLSWSADHLICIRRIEKSVIHGGQFGVALPRGSGKTTICEGAILWAVAHGHRRYPVVIGATQESAEAILESIQRELENNERLQEDFPGLAIPIAAVDGKAIRARAQLYHGALTGLRLKKNEIEFASIRGASNGSLIGARGLTGNLRGLKKKTKLGEPLRPDFVFLDDPQTDESAQSPSQTKTRLELVLGTILGLAGPGNRIAALCACTVIAPGDLSDQLLNTDTHPEWQGVRSGLVERWPDEQDGLWQKYRAVRATGLSDGDGGAAGTEYYREHRAAMDAGAVVTWEQRHDPGELSALQHAENLLIDRGRKVFFSEFQNQPELEYANAYTVTAEEVAASLSGQAQFVAPKWAHHLAAFVDINNYGLHWVVAGVGSDMTAAVVAYGKHPAGKRVLVPAGSTETVRDRAVWRGLSEMCAQLEGMPFTRDGRAHPLQLLLIDCGYVMETVCRFCQQVKAPFRVMPSRGVAEKDYRQRKAVGQPRTKCHVVDWGSKGYVLMHNADWWRMKVCEGWVAPAGSPASMSIWGDDPQRHEEYAQQSTAEFLKEYIQGSVADHYLWGRVPGSRNDLQDCNTGALVGGHMLGASFHDTSTKPKPPQRQSKRRSSRIQRD